MTWRAQQDFTFLREVLAYIIFVLDKFLVPSWIFKYIGGKKWQRMSSGERWKLKECPWYYTSYKYNKPGWIELYWSPEGLLGWSSGYLTTGREENMKTIQLFLSITRLHDVVCTHKSKNYTLKSKCRCFPQC